MQMYEKKRDYRYVKMYKILTRALGVCFSPMAGWLRLLYKKRQKRSLI